MTNRRDDLTPLPEPAGDSHDDGGWGPWLRRNITKDNIRFVVEIVILLAASFGLQEACSARKEAENNSAKIEATNQKVEQEAEKTRRTVTGMRNPLGEKGDGK